MTQEHKRVAIIDGKEYKVGYPQCAGCENLCLPWPSECLYEGEGCEYPESRVKEEGEQNAVYHRTEIQSTRDHH